MTPVRDRAGGRHGDRGGIVRARRSIPTRAGPASRVAAGAEADQARFAEKPVEVGGQARRPSRSVERLRAGRPSGARVARMLVRYTLSTIRHRPCAKRSREPRRSRGPTLQETCCACVCDNGKPQSWGEEPARPATRASCCTRLDAGGRIFPVTRADCGPSCPAPPVPI